MRASTANKAPFPLLPGVVDVVVGGNFVGRGMMKLTAPGETIRLGLGVDESIKIEMKLLEDRVERKRWGDKVATTNVFEIRATSFAAEPVSLAVIDQLPISQVPDVKIRCEGEGRRALRGAEFPGQLQWILQLEPRKTSRIEFDFTIEYPESLRQALEQDGNKAIDYEYEKVEQEFGQGAAAAPEYRNVRNAAQAKQAVAF